MILLRVAIIIVAGLSLSACFVSDAPLITPETADYPIPHGSVFIKSSVVRTQTDYEPFDNAVVISRDFANKVARTGGTYLHEETGANGTKNVSRGLMQEIGKGTYLVMTDDKERDRYWYGLFVREGEEWVQYKVLCDDLALAGERAGVRLAEFGVVRTPSGACKFTSFEKLAHAIAFARSLSPKARAWARYKKPPAPTGSAW